jgi:hypothetical protein
MRKTMREYIVRETDCGLATKQEIVGELVRCKDCKHSFMLFGRMHCESFADTDYLMLDEDDFCCRGERKADATN